MSNEEPRFARLDALVETMVAGCLTADEQVEFEGILGSDQHARQRYLERMFLVGSLRWMSRSGADRSRDGEQTQAAGSGDTAGARDPANPSPGILSFLGVVWETAYSSPRIVVMILGGVLTTYFIIMLAMIPFARWTQQSRTEQPGTRHHETADKLTTTPGAKVGSFTATDEARWSFRSAVPADEIVRVGRRYELAGGRADIVLTRGVRVAIEGPAQWELASEQRLKIGLGKLAAQVPRQGVGFTVVTPTAEVIDLGTEFGVDVDSQGDTDLHVIRGQVEVKPASGSAGRPAPGQRIVAGQAVRVSVPGQATARIPFDGARFDSARSSVAAVALSGPQRARQISKRRPIWLGNLFDDAADVPLEKAMRTDTFQATAEVGDLGVELVLYGTDAVKQLSPSCRFDLSALGWQEAFCGSIANDCWTVVEPAERTGGIRTIGLGLALDAPKTEEGIGMHANAAITFDLAAIRAAGNLKNAPLAFICDRAGINDNSYGISIASVHMAAVASDLKGVVAASVDGEHVKTECHDGTWRITSPIGRPLRGDGRFVPFRITLPITTKYLTLIAASAGDVHGFDHAVWSGARLVVEAAPTPATILDKQPGSPALKKE
jgi:hypothetical protein